MKRTLIAALVLAVIATACSGDPQRDPTSTSTPPTSGSTPSTPSAPSTASPVAQGDLPSCDTIQDVHAPDDWYRDSPVYVGNEMPVEAVQAWAARQPGYQSIWVDRDRNGWITVAFSQDVADRQADLIREFPGVGVVAVEVGWSVRGLRTLQDRVVAELRGITDSFGVGVAETRGIVEISLGRLSDDDRQLIAELFAGEPVCVSAPDQSALPEPGPQPQEGDGWQLLLAAQGAGRTYHTAIATDSMSLGAMWSDIGVRAPTPDVDFEQSVVIWFGAVYGSSCSNLRFDDVVIDGNTIHAHIVLPDAPIACTSDARPYAFVVAVDRDVLPSGPFAIQLDADGPPGGAPEERTVVDANLTIPGSVASPDQISQGGGEPRDTSHRSGDVIEPGFPALYRMFVHCGIGHLGELNSVLWSTAEETPVEWQGLIDGDTLVVSVTIREGQPPTLEAVANGVAVLYTPTTELPPPCD